MEAPGLPPKEAIVRQHVVAIFLTLFVVEPLGAQEEHARFDFPVTVDGQEHILTYDGTHDVMRDADPRVKLVVFVHHGGSQYPTTYFVRLVAAMNAADRDRPGLALRATTLVVSAAMIGDHHIADRPARYAEGHYPSLQRRQGRQLHPRGHGGTGCRHHERQDSACRGWVHEDGRIEVRIFDR